MSVGKTQVHDCWS